MKLLCFQTNSVIWLAAEKNLHRKTNGLNGNTYKTVVTGTGLQRNSSNFEAINYLVTEIPLLSTRLA